MSGKKSYDERLEIIQKKKSQLDAREKALKKLRSEEDRKKRTKRLIELGGIVESVLGRETTDEDKQRFLNFLRKQEVNGNFFSKAMNISLNSDAETEG
ncbi:MAG: relaxasome subunit MobC [Blautia sp.]|nr:relaxasome subunit MobC [Blautia sp.]